MNRFLQASILFFALLSAMPPFASATRQCESYFAWAPEAFTNPEDLQSPENTTYRFLIIPFDPATRPQEIVDSFQAILQRHTVVGALIGSRANPAPSVAGWIVEAPLGYVVDYHPDAEMLGVERPKIHTPTEILEHTGKGKSHWNAVELLTNSGRGSLKVRGVYLRVTEDGSSPSLTGPQRENLRTVARRFNVPLLHLVNRSTLPFLNCPRRVWERSKSGGHWPGM